MNLSKRQESLLKNLLDDDAWVALLDQIEADAQVKAWKPSKDKGEDEKNAQWIYQSGMQRKVSDILTIFRMNT